ncbi:hypothetical protein PPNSA23_02490 [Phyllobacterium phragmitis]|uniref:Uncharacterized protein n=1 Tax=Phyllobacterium phragmitis TaxID=2670329 RepID=A0ABQ0GUF3_9HYPH
MHPLTSSDLIRRSVPERRCSARLSDDGYDFDGPEWILLSEPDDDAIAMFFPVAKAAITSMPVAGALKRRFS